MNSQQAYDYEEHILNQHQNTNFISVISVIIDIIKGLDEMIYLLDDQGNIKVNAKGKPRINWIKVIKNLAKIIGALMAMRKKAIW
jgi:hypothetical protein